MILWGMFLLIRNPQEFQGLDGKVLKTINNEQPIVEISPISKEQEAEIERLIEITSTDKTALLKFLKTDNIGALDDAAAKKAIAALKQKETLVAKKVVEEEENLIAEKLIEADWKD